MGIYEVLQEATSHLTYLVPAGLSYCCARFYNATRPRIEGTVTRVQVRASATIAHVRTSDGERTLTFDTYPDPIVICGTNFSKKLGLLEELVQPGQTLAVNVHAETLNPMPVHSIVTPGRRRASTY